MTMYSLDPPDDEGPDPTRCTCGAELVTYDDEQVCPTCDLDDMRPCIECGRLTQAARCWWHLRSEDLEQ